MIKKHLSLAVCAFTVGTGPLLADLSGNVAISSDYRFRGITQTDSTIAISGGLDYGHESGFYAGIWASNVDFQVQAVDDATAEVDLYLGFSGDIADSGFSYDVGVLRFAYPNSDSSLSYDFTEVYGSVGYENYTFLIAKTSDYFAGSGDATYYNLSADFELTDSLTLSAAYGQQDVEDNNAWGTPNWNDYKLALSTSFAAVDWELAFIDTNLSEAECFGGTDWCDATVVLTVSKSMD